MKRFVMGILLVFFVSIAQETCAQTQGGGPPGGAIYTIAIDPLNHYTLYAGTDLGVFKSINGGASWNPARAGLPDGYVGLLAVDPLNSSTLYAGGNFLGIFKSADGGHEYEFASDTDN